MARSSKTSRAADRPAHRAARPNVPRPVLQHDDRFFVVEPVARALAGAEAQAPGGQLAGAAPAARLQQVESRGAGRADEGVAQHHAHRAGVGSGLRLQLAGPLGKRRAGFAHAVAVAHDAVKPLAAGGPLRPAQAPTRERVPRFGPVRDCLQARILRHRRPGRGRPGRRSTGLLRAALLEQPTGWATVPAILAASFRRRFPVAISTSRGSARRATASPTARRRFETRSRRAHTPAAGASWCRPASSDRRDPAAEPRQPAPGRRARRCAFSQAIRGTICRWCSRASRASS